MNMHPHIQEIARLREHELRRRSSRPRPRPHAVEAADATAAVRPESLAILLRAAARVTTAQA